MLRHARDMNAVRVVVVRACVRTGGLAGCALGVLLAGGCVQQEAQRASIEHVGVELMPATGALAVGAPGTEPLLLPGEATGDALAQRNQGRDR